MGSLLLWWFLNKGKITISNNYQWIMANGTRPLPNPRRLVAKSTNTTRHGTNVLHLELLFLLLEQGQLSVDVWIHVVRNVLAVHDLRYAVQLPRVVLRSFVFVRVFKRMMPINCHDKAYKKNSRPSIPSSVRYWGGAPSFVHRRRIRTSLIY